MEPDPLDYTVSVPDAGLPMAILEALLEEWETREQLTAEMRERDAAAQSRL